MTTAVAGCLKMNGSCIRSTITHGAQVCRSVLLQGMSVLAAEIESGFRELPFFPTGCV